MNRKQIVGALNGFMLVVLTSWAFFQYNDPDGPLWMGVYGVAVAGIILFEYRRVSARMLWLYSGLTALWGIYWAVQFAAEPSYLMADTPMLVETGREMVGTWIVSAWMAFLAIRRSREKRSV
jgi:hypothetical protein